MSQSAQGLAPRLSVEAKQQTTHVSVASDHGGTGEHTASQAPAADRATRHTQTLNLFRRIARLPAASTERARLRDRAIAEHMNYARHLARGYARNTSSAAEDLDQVAYLGLVRAVDQFDPEYGTNFLTYATPMILGEIRRYFRDGTWAVHVPRRMQEISRALFKARDRLSCELGREPTVPELAERLGVEADDVVDALEAADAYRTTSLDRPVGGDEGSAPLAELIGHDDPGFDAAINRTVLRTLIPQLSDRDKRILLLRYFRGMTQSEIGREIGTSQMQVSRILSGILTRLRQGFTAEA